MHFFFNKYKIFLYKTKKIIDQYKKNNDLIKTQNGINRSI